MIRSKLVACSLFLAVIANFGCSPKQQAPTAPVELNEGSRKSMKPPNTPKATQVPVDDN